MVHKSPASAKTGSRDSEDNSVAKSTRRGIRSKSRVRDLGEVFTPARTVNDMLDMVDHKTREIESRFLEPSCGNGNFLVEILRRKLGKVKEVSFDKHSLELNTLLALSSIYGIDINFENVNESRQRMRTITFEFLANGIEKSRHTNGFPASIDYVLSKNIVLGDFLNGRNKIFFTEFKVSIDQKLKQRVFRLSDLNRKGLMQKAEPKPVSEKSEINYWELGSNDQESTVL